MLPEKIHLLISGERPTRAGPSPRAEVSVGSVAGNRPWGRTRAGPRGPVMKWSERDEPIRCRLVAFPADALPLGEWVAWRACASLTRYSWVSSSVEGRDYRRRWARQQLTMTAGTLTPSCPEPTLRKGTGRYKLCEIRSWRRWRDGRVRALQRGQHLPSKTRPMAAGTGSVPAESSRCSRGETIVEG